MKYFTLTLSLYQAPCYRSGRHCILCFIIVTLESKRGLHPGRSGTGLLYTSRGVLRFFECHSMGPPSSLSLIIGPIKRKIDLLSKEISMFSRTNWSWYQPVSHSTDCSRRRDIPRVDVPCSCFGTRTCRTASRQ